MSFACLGFTSSCTCDKTPGHLHALSPRPWAGPCGRAAGCGAGLLGARGAENQGLMEDQEWQPSPQSSLGPSLKLPRTPKLPCLFKTGVSRKQQAPVSCPEVGLGFLTPSFGLRGRPSICPSSPEPGNSWVQL